MIFLSVFPREKITFGLGSKKVSVNLNRINMVFQFSILFLLSIMQGATAHDSQWVLPFMMLTGLMGIKYRLIQTRGLVITMVIFAASIEFSAYNDGLPMRGLFVLLFASFFFGLAFVMYNDELKRYFELVNKYRKKLIDVEDKLTKISGETLNPDDMGFTPREMDVLKELCLHRGGNKEIAETLGITQQTVKTHIKKIFDKAGVDDRYQLIDLFRHAFID